MNVVHPMNASLEAVAAMPTRPATAAIYDAPAVRLVVFRIEPGQEVAPHTNNGTVILTVLSGTGSIMGGTEWRELGPGSVVSYAPDVQRCRVAHRILPCRFRRWYDRVPRAIQLHDAINFFSRTREPYRVEFEVVEVGLQRLRRVAFGVDSYVQHHHLLALVAQPPRHR